MTDTQTMRAPGKPTNELEACIYLKERVEYRDGNIYWTHIKQHGWKGRIAGCLHNGYRRITVFRYGLVSAHRLIYFMFTGVLPEIVDHIDGNPSNNCFENLRAATVSQNCQNSATPARNTSGRKGVYWSKATNKWQASIRVKTKLKYLGVFKEFDDAVTARVKAEKEFYGEFANNR